MHFKIWPTNKHNNIVPLSCVQMLCQKFTSQTSYRIIPPGNPSSSVELIKFNISTVNYKTQNKKQYPKKIFIFHVKSKTRKKRRNNNKNNKNRTEIFQILFFNFFFLTAVVAAAASSNDDKHLFHWFLLPQLMILIGNTWLGNFFCSLLLNHNLLLLGFLFFFIPCANFSHKWVCVWVLENYNNGNLIKFKIWYL